MPNREERPGSNRRAALQKMLGMGAGLAASNELLAQQASRPAVRNPSAGWTLFAFDDTWIPLQHGLRLNLVSYQSNEGGPVTNRAIAPGPPGSPDGAGMIYYGTVCKVGDEYWMWYLGLGDRDPQKHFRVCLARSTDGKKWEKPNLGLVEYNGSRRNNLVDLDQGHFSAAGCVVYHDPEDPDPNRRFKMIFTGKYQGLHFAVAYSADGLRWKESPKNPRGAVKFEPGGGIKYNGVYYVNGQGGRHWSPDGWARTMITHMSYDFENWTTASVMGFRRDPIPPHPLDRGESTSGEQVHLGAGLWDRGNVVLGLYGQWHGDPNADRRWVSIDTGFVISHDCLHFREPIPDFRMIQSKEQFNWWLPGGKVAPVYRAPALMQGQGFANIGDESLFWYSVWVVPEEGIRYARWERDRLGYLQPFVAPQDTPHVVSAVLPTEGKPVTVHLNVANLNDLSKVKVAVLDEHFQELPGFRSADCTGPVQAGLRQKVEWGGRERVEAPGPIRIRVDFAGVRPEDLRLYAMYVDPIA
jgi:hypothetical protein